MEISAKSRLRITIESLLIDLNEEIFALSEELAKSFTTDKSAHLISKAREFDMRKKQMIKRVQQTIDEDPIAKLVRREQNIRKRSRSPMENSGSRSRSKEKFVPLRNPVGGFVDQKMDKLDRGHSPPQRDEHQGNQRLAPNQYASVPHLEKIIDVGDSNDKYFQTSYANTVTSASHQELPPNIFPKSHHES